jgi:hypothetical protein
MSPVVSFWFFLLMKLTQVQLVYFQKSFRFYQELLQAVFLLANPNVQQVTKGDDFVGSNRIKHMTDSMAHIERSRDRLQRTIYFSKNRDCDKDFKMYFSFYKDKVFYTFEEEEQ